MSAVQELVKAVEVKEEDRLANFHPGARDHDLQV
jgi:hypothetical protein